MSARFWVKVKNTISGKREPVFLFILFSVIVISALFLLLKDKVPAEENTPLRPGEEYGVEYRQPGEIKVEDIGNNQKRVTDTRQGYSVVILSDWQIENPETIDRDISFYDNVNKCKFIAGIIYNSNLQSIEKNIEDEKPYLTIRKYEVLDTFINGYIGKHIILDSEEGGYGESFYLVLDDNIFSVSLGSENSNELCSQALNLLVERLQF